MDLGRAVGVARAGGRFRECLLLFDTCQAATMGEAAAASGVLALASSVRGQNR